MYPVSAAFLSAVKANTRKYYWTGRITTKAGDIYDFDQDDIVKGSGYITSQCCGSTEIELGTVYAAEMGISLFSEIDRYTLEDAIIKDLCDEAGCKVEFRTEKDDFVVAFYRNLRETWTQNLDGTNQVNNQVKVQDNKVTEQDREKIIIEYCSVPRSRAEIQEYIGISNRGYFRTKILEPLLESGKIVRTIPDKPNSRNQKYVASK